MMARMLVWLLCGCGALGAAILPPERRIEWQAGIPGGIPFYPNEINVREKPCNAVGDGVADDTEAIQKAIRICRNGRAVYLPAGTYRTTAQLNITGNKCIVIRGDGPERTRILLDTWQQANVIKIYEGSQPAPAIDIKAGCEKGSRTLEISPISAVTIAKGDLIWISQLDDPNFVTIQTYTPGKPCGYCGQRGNRCMAQYDRVMEKHFGKLVLEQPLYFTFPAGLRPQLVKTPHIDRCGVEDLCLDRARDNRFYPDANGARIVYGCDCWMKNVESRNTVGAHCRLEHSYQCEFRDCIFHGGFDYGSGRAYGMMIFERNSAHLIENNIFYKCRHSVIFEAGGSGCVVDYNFATNEYSWPDPNFLALDFGTHGAHPYMNLFEGNIFGKWTQDLAHGSSSHNTVFRCGITGNRSQATGGLFWVDIESHNYSNSVVGCVLASVPHEVRGFDDNAAIGPHCVVRHLGYESPGSSGMATDPKVAATTLWTGVWDPFHDSVVWDTKSGDHTLPASLFLESPPSWWRGAPWPPIGPDRNPMISKIPAQLRFDALVAASQVPEDSIILPSK